MSRMLNAWVGGAKNNEELRMNANVRNIATSFIVFSISYLVLGIKVRDFSDD